MCVPVLLQQELPEDALLCPLIDARRMEVYAAVYDRALNVVREIGADIVDETSYLNFLEEHPVYFFGNGSSKCRAMITHPNAHFIDDVYPLARWSSIPPKLTSSMNALKSRNPDISNGFIKLSLATRLLITSTISVNHENLVNTKIMNTMIVGKKNMAWSASVTTIDSCPPAQIR